MTSPHHAGLLILSLVCIAMGFLMGFHYGWLAHEIYGERWAKQALAWVRKKLGDERAN